MGVWGCGGVEMGVWGVEVGMWGGDEEHRMRPGFLSKERPALWHWLPWAAAVPGTGKVAWTGPRSLSNCVYSVEGTALTSPLSWGPAEP